MGYVETHRHIHAALRAGRSKDDVWRELSPAVDAKALRRALAEHPDPEAARRHRPLTWALTGLMLVALAAKVVVLLRFADEASALGVSPALPFVLATPAILLFGVYFAAVPLEMGFAYRAALFMGVYTVATRFGDAMAGDLGTRIDVAFGLLVATLAGALMTRMFRAYEPPAAPA